MRSQIICILVAMLVGVTGLASAGIEYQSNHNTDDLIIYQFQAEAWTSVCWGGGLVTDPAAEPAAANNNAFRVPDNQGCEVNLVGGFQQEVGIYHLYARIRGRTLDSQGAETGIVLSAYWQIIYSKVSNANTYYSTFVPAFTEIPINPDTTQNGIYPYTTIDLSSYYNMTWRDYSHPETPAGSVIDEWLHVWLPDTTPNMYLYMDTWYMSTVQ